MKGNRVSLSIFSDSKFTLWNERRVLIYFGGFSLGFFIFVGFFQFDEAAFFDSIGFSPDRTAQKSMSVLCIC